MPLICHLYVDRLLRGPPRAAQEHREHQDLPLVVPRGHPAVQAGPGDVRPALELRLQEAPHRQRRQQPRRVERLHRQGRRGSHDAGG